MKSPAAFLVCLIVGWPLAGLSQAAEFLVIGKNTFAFHEELFGEHRIKIEPPAVIDAEIFVELIGIPNAAKINSLRVQIRRSFGLKNAVAVFDRGFRSIVYDPNWAKSATPDFYLALGHEAGHHICEHTIDPSRSNLWERELEADRFAGASIRRFEVYHNKNFIDDVMAAAYRKYSETGSLFYPPRARRLAAVRKGYDEGSPCGDLAPVEQGGFSRGRR